MPRPGWPLPGTTLIAPLFVLLWALRPGAGWAPGPWAPVLVLPLAAGAWLWGLMVGFSAYTATQ